MFIDFLSNITALRITMENAIVKTKRTTALLKAMPPILIPLPPAVSRSRSSCPPTARDRR